MTERDRKYLEQAYILARECSPDPSTQNAALLVDFSRRAGTFNAEDEPGICVCSAVNRIPDGVDFLNDRCVSPLKYHFFEHAERNVIYAAAKLGVRTRGLTMYAAWAACTDCARAIIQSGIAVLVRHECAGASDGKWANSIAIADEMLTEAGIVVRTVKGKIDPTNTLNVRRGGGMIYP